MPIKASVVAHVLWPMLPGLACIIITCFLSSVNCTARHTLNYPPFIWGATLMFLLLFFSHKERFLAVSCMQPIDIRSTSNDTWHFGMSENGPGNLILSLPTIINRHLSNRTYLTSALVLRQTSERFCY